MASHTRERAPSIRLRRTPSVMNLASHMVVSDNVGAGEQTHPAQLSSRNGIDSVLQPPSAARVPHRKPVATPSFSNGLPLRDLEEGVPRESFGERPADLPTAPEIIATPSSRTPRDYFTRHNSGATIRSALSFGRRPTNVSNSLEEGPRPARADGNRHGEYDSNLVDLLDLVDPEIQTLQTLNNVQNSLFVPNFGRFLNRRPTYDLSQRQRDDSDSNDDDDTPPTAEALKAAQSEIAKRLERANTRSSISSDTTKEHYAVLPHGVSLDGWSEEDKRELDDHVRHMLHSRMSRFKRSMKGFGQYVRKPLGFFVTLYATLITLFGLAWVLFLIGWINVGGRQLYIINVIDNVLVALFAIMGDGLIPWRLYDTYHMIWVAHYAHTTWRLRREKSLPKLQNRNELPRLHEMDVEAGDKDQELSVLSQLQHKRLLHHQGKLERSHTFYRPKETGTHHAFPIRLLIAVVVLLDCHSCLQVSLGVCTWAIDYRKRPFALTTVILCCSIAVNITAGILISIGDHKTRKKDVLEKMHKQALTQEAIRKLEKRREREAERNDTVDGGGVNTRTSGVGSLGGMLPSVDEDEKVQNGGDVGAGRDAHVVRQRIENR